MTKQLITPVIPPAVGTARGGPGSAGGRRPLPLASLLAIPLDAVYGMSRVDASGRVAGQVITGVLGWQPGDRLTQTADAGVVLARRDPYGMVTVPVRRCIAIPAALRHRCGLRAGDRVLLAALPREDTLTAYTLALVDQVLRAHISFPGGEGDQS